MTRIRNLLRAFSARGESFQRSDSVSFEAFCNESPQQNRVKAKESSLNGDTSLSPIKKAPDEKYVRFSRNSGGSPRCNRPSLPVILLVLVITAVFLILPLMYVLHCFKMLYIDDQQVDISHINNEVHYEPSAKIHEILQYTKPSKLKQPTLPPPPKPDYNQCKIFKENERYDCFPEDKATQEGCEARGCCWIPAKTKPKHYESPLNVPYCFYPANYPTYNYLNITETAFGLEAFLKRNYVTAYPNDVEIIKMTVKYETQNRLHVQITDPLNDRFNPPFPEVPIVDKAAANLTYQFIRDPLRSGFMVRRKSDSTVLFNATNLSNFIFSDQFLQISAKLPSTYIYGLGEHRSNLLLSTNWSRFTLFNHDGIPAFNKNLYGSHPFYLMMEKSGNSHGVLLLNSNAMDVILQPGPAITFRPIGGIFNFYFFLGPSPADVVEQYTDLIGRPYMPPYWGLGFHLCRFGYKSLNETKQVMQRNLDAGIPLDTQWNDLDYMNNSNDFTYDDVLFKGLPDFVKDLHKRGMHYIPLVDPGVSASEPAGSYPPYDELIKRHNYVKNSSSDPFIGKVWNTKSTIWPDFTHPDTVRYWITMLRSLHDLIPFDGAWIDMNEPSNFLTGSFNGCPKSALENPPYLPGVEGGVLSYKTMCMSAQHFAGLHYNVHNLYGLTETIVTNFALAEIRGKRPMVISRSTFPGQGHYGGHWSGDVVSDWLDMRYSIPELLSFSLFGIPLMGADICGFNGNTTASLCNRWMQLGAFYPFSRNHNTDDGIDQDPVAMGPQVTVSSRKALTIRYSFLPYLYTLFWSAHVNGETVARPLFFEFTKDVNTYGVDTQFLWGPALLIVPVLEENAVSVNAYLPSSIWYDFYTKSPINSDGANFNLSAPIDTIPLLIRGGYILPRQVPAQNTVKARKNLIEILAAPDEEGKASGELYWDDGDSLNSYNEKRYSLLRFDMQKGILRSKNVLWGPENPPNLGSVLVLGIEQAVSEVLVNNMNQAFRFDTIHKYLAIDSLDVSFKSSVTITWKCQLTQIIYNIRKQIVKKLQIYK